MMRLPIFIAFEIWKNIGVGEDSPGGDSSGDFLGGRIYQGGIWPGEIYQGRIFLMPMFRSY